MKYIYASRTGNIENFIDNLKIEAVRISDGEEEINEEFILFTYTDGLGEVPYEVETFLNKNNKYLKGVIASGDQGYGDENYCKAGEIISSTYQVPYLYHFENFGNEEDLEKVKKILDEYQK